MYAVEAEARKGTRSFRSFVAVVAAAAVERNFAANARGTLVHLALALGTESGAALKTEIDDSTPFQVDSASRSPLQTYSPLSQVA